MEIERYEIHFDGKTGREHIRLDFAWFQFPPGLLSFSFMAVLPAFPARLKIFQEGFCKIQPAR